MVLAGKKKYSEGALKLSRLIKNGVRTLVIIELVSLVMYIMYRSVYRQKTIYERTDMGFFIAGQITCILLSIFFIHMPEYASRILDLLLLFTFMNFCSSIVEVVNAFDVNLMNETIVIIFTFLGINAVFLSISLVMRTLSYDLWDEYYQMTLDGVFDIWDRFRDVNHEADPRENMVFSAVEYNNVYFKNPTMCGVVSTLLPVEVVLLYFYILFMVSEENAPASGWFFCLHVLTISSTTAWFASGGSKKQIKGLESWMFQSLLLVTAFDLTQLVYVGSNDMPEIIGIRIMLVIVAFVYLGVLFYAMAMDKYREKAAARKKPSSKKRARVTLEVAKTSAKQRKNTSDEDPEEIETDEEERDSDDDNDEYEENIIEISKPTLMFFFYQYIVPSIGVCDVLFVGLYFAFVSAMHIQNPMWWNSVHVFDGIVAIICSFLGSSALDCMLILVICAFLTILYDIMIIGLMPGFLAPRYSTEYVIEVFFLIFDFIYIISFGITWINATMEDADKYAVIASKDKIVAYELFVLQSGPGQKSLNWKSSTRPRDLVNIGSDDVVGVNDQVKDANKKKTKKDEERSAQEVQTEIDEEMTMRAKKNAEKIYYVVVVLIRNVFILESVDFIFYTLIMADGTYRWYEWFYLVHAFTIMTAIVCMTFELNTKLSLSFLMGFAFLDLGVDVALISVLASTDSLNDGKMTIRSLFIVSDFFYLLFSGLILGFAAAPDFAALLFMKTLGKRIRESHT